MDMVMHKSININVKNKADKSKLLWRQSPRNTKEVKIFNETDLRKEKSCSVQNIIRDGDQKT